MAVDPNNSNKETLSFQAESKQLLHLMIHSLYSNKEIFLRELISNASDAIDRLRFALISNEIPHEDDTDYNIHVSYDQDARTITVSDNGIGMSRDDVIDQIGTIAKSGTREFLESLKDDQKKDRYLIGQFGVGFYSSFVVADKVTLTSRRAGLDTDQGVRWESDGEGEYTLETVTKPERGTTVTLNLREDEDEFLNGFRLRSIIRKYSDHITVPIMMPVEEEGKQGEEQVNAASALWTRPKSEISPEEYTEFYHHIAHDFGDPLAYIHSRIEGTHEYILLLYIPEHAPFDLWQRERRHGVKLYVKRVFIMDDAEQLMPGYLRFVRGLVDSSDLPLNVSREILQHNRLIDSMRNTAVKRVLGLLNDLVTNSKEKYATFWQEFGRAFKEGLAEDPANRESIANLLRFASTVSGNETQDVSLDDYIDRMKPGQDKIYFISADSYAAAKDSPLLEIFKQKGVEVLLLSDQIDYLIGTELEKFRDFPLQSVSKGQIDLSNVVSEQTEPQQEQPAEQPGSGEMQDLLQRLKGVLGEKVKDVRVSTRLTTSPACLVVDERDIDPTLQRLLKAAGQPFPSSKPILEINPQHVIVRKLGSEQDEKRFGDWATILYDQSVLSNGETLEDPRNFVSKLNDLLAQL